MDPAIYAFLVAYKWWLEQDVYFLGVLNGNPGNLNTDTLRLILKAYGASRTVALDDRAAYVALIAGIGQANGIVERAQLIAGALANINPPAVSAVTKVHWFIQPTGWTMYDSHASNAVLGRGNQPAINRMLAFYQALSDRGWDELIGSLRVILNQHGFNPLLAERTIDKFLWLSQPRRDADQQRERHVAFREALPPELGNRIIQASVQISAQLAASRLRHQQ